MRFIILLCSLFVFTSVYAADEENTPPVAIYYKLNPQFVVNLQGNKHYLRTTIELQLENKDLKSVVEEHDAVLRHTLIFLLSENHAEDMRKIQGREELRLTAIKELNKALKKYAKKTGIVNVFFTTFVYK